LDNGKTNKMKSVLMVMRNNIKIADTGPVKGRVFSYLRWSTPQQQWGDSERRQAQMAEDWCQRNGCTLAERQFADSGISAFHGQNQQGDLATLLKAMRRGDKLLVEDLDRLSRQDWFSAMTFMASILAKGVEIISLRNGCEITEDTFRHNPGVFLPAIFTAHLGHDESAKKAYRVKKSWDARKAALKEGKVMNQNLPSWLRWNRERKQVELIDERAKTVARIFDLYLEFGSIRTVTRKLVAEGVPSISKCKQAAWANSYVSQILNNRAVLGDCLHTDPPTPNIYPAIVTEKKFYAVQERLKAGRCFTERTKSKAANLFTGICRCSQCGSAMNLNTARRPGNLKAYLTCGAALHDRLDCVRTGMRYEAVESAILGLLCQDQAIRENLTGAKAEPDKLEILRGKLAEVQKRGEKYLRLIDNEDNPTKAILHRLQAAEAEESALQAEIEQEEAKTKAQGSPQAAYKALRGSLSVATVTITDRGRMRELLRGVLEKVIVNTTEKELVMYLKGGRKPIGVKLFATHVRP
jgi:DNA invertase Pin-like site-specific DNA recombinase